jgi:hypothetical protein
VLRWPCAASHGGVSPTLVPSGVDKCPIIMSGGVGERLKPAVLKTVRLERVSGVRIPPPPPHKAVANQLYSSYNPTSEFIQCQK